jgi:ribonucleoside-diphosphate reductase alpha chain
MFLQPGVNMYSYQEALEDSKNYFSNEELPAKVFIDKYALRDNSGNILESNPSQTHRRLAKEFARIEKNKFQDPMTEDEIFDLFYKFNALIPQGSPIAAIGNPHQFLSSSNCFVLDSPVDSYGGILKTDQELVQISKRRGGIGIDLSNLRPTGSPTLNSSRTSTGIRSWMNRYSNSIREVGQGGRRGALMLTLSVHHPDIVDFITAKDDGVSVTGANISVRVSDEFLEAVKNNIEYELRFPKMETKMVSAKEIWDKMMFSAWNRAEPGILFWDRIKSESPADCYENFQTVSTNPCGEITLSPNDSCRLLAINLFSCIVNPYYEDSYFDFKKLYDLAITGQRLLDDLIDLEIEKINEIIAKIKKDPEDKEVKQLEIDLWKKILKACENGRRTGLGITAIGDVIAANGLKYGSDESIAFVEKVYKTLKFGSYKSSVEMAKELGPFPDWDWDKEKDNPFLLRIKDECIDLDNPLGVMLGKTLYEDMSKYGRRNIANLTTAPTGTISILAGIKIIETWYHNISSGIEPVYLLAMTRRKKGNPGDKEFRSDFVDPNGDHWMEFTVYHSPLQGWMDVTGNTEIDESCPYVGATAPEIDWVQRVKLQSAAQRHVDHSISSTVNIPNETTQEEVEKIYRAAWENGCKGVTIYRDGCRTGVLIKKEESKILRTNATKRPKSLKCDIHTISVNKNKFTVIVGLLEGSPYEVFCVKDYIETAKHGELIKLNKSKYKLVSEEHQIELSNLLDDDAQNALMRMMSAALRHGADIQFIVEQLQKTNGDMTSMSKSVARALKKYIKDNTYSNEKCSCGEKLIYQEGCLVCKSCGYSKCG